MRSALHRLLVISLATWTIAGCVGEAASPTDLQPAGESLQRKGVYYLEVTGTADHPTFTFYDQNKAVIGEGHSARDSQQAEIQWRGNSWERTEDAFRKTGAEASVASDASDLDAALTVFELGLDQAFPPGPVVLNAHANSCTQPSCSRPNNRCLGGCAGYSCTVKNGGKGVCMETVKPTPPPSPP